jgi:hypothetical protein
VSKSRNCAAAATEEEEEEMSPQIMLLVGPCFPHNGIATRWTPKPIAFFVTQVVSHVPSFGNVKGIFGSGK